MVVYEFDRIVLPSITLVIITFDVFIELDELGVDEVVIVVELIDDEIDVVEEDVVLEGSIELLELKVDNVEDELMEDEIDE